MVRKKTDPTLEPDEGLSEDERMAKAIFAACEGFGLALFETIKEGRRPFGSPGHSESGSIEKVKQAWNEAAAKIIAVAMEED